MKEKISRYWPIVLPWLGLLLMPVLAGGVTVTIGGYYIEFKVQKVMADAHAAAQSQLEQTKGEIVQATEALTLKAEEIHTSMAGAVRLPNANRKKN